MWALSTKKKGGMPKQFPPVEKVYGDNHRSAHRHNRAVSCFEKVPDTSSAIGIKHYSPDPYNVINEFQTLAVAEEEGHFLLSEKKFRERRTKKRTKKKIKAVTRVYLVLVNSSFSLKFSRHLLLLRKFRIFHDCILECF